MGCQLGIVLVIQGNAGKGPSDGGRVAGVDLLENDWKEMQGEERKPWRERERKWGIGKKE